MIRRPLLLLTILLPTWCHAADRIVSPEYTETELSEFDYGHWSVRPVERPMPPDVEDAAWCRNVVDRFVLAKIEEAGLAPMPETDRHTLLRRVTFDLTGLPPTPAEVADFLADDSPDAYERVVDRLLASPAYGERWAQHWLDLARFAETDGFEHDKLRPNAWRYRDWVIDALNAGLPYDEFVRLQIAGDELRPGEADALIATGFLLCGPDMPDINDQNERRHVFLNGVASTVGSVFLGLQVGCAQCHDHVYDPIRQADFYRLRAFFDNADLFEDKPLPDAEKQFARAVLDFDSTPRTSHLWIRGDFRREGPIVEPTFPPVVNAEGVAVEPTPSEASSGVRAELADWLTRPENPLTTRVLVNRLWQYHFGRGIVGTTSDFGRMGEEPTHPELLDWLASELPRRGWSLKAMHRLLVTSATYRQASRPTNDAWSPAVAAIAKERWQASVAEDADNDLLTRARRRRLSGEAIRDAMLAASDRLNRQPQGPGVRPPLPRELVSTLLKNQWPVTQDEGEHDRRSVYVFVRRNLPYPMFKTFDRPDTNASCPERDRSTTAPQALTLLNSEFAREAAGDFARFLSERAPEDAVEAAFVRTLGRPPTAEEQSNAIRFLEEQAPETSALADLCLVLFNLNEFVYVD